jgi:hypothetical protein
MDKRTKKDCQFLIDTKMLPWAIIRIGGVSRLITTILDGGGLYSSTPVKSWNSLYTELEAMPSNAPAPDPEPVPVIETPAPVELDQ